jgi:hypothetical protein
VGHAPTLILILSIVASLRGAAVHVRLDRFNKELTLLSELSKHYLLSERDFFMPKEGARTRRPGFPILLTFLSSAKGQNSTATTPKRTRTIDE